MIAAVTGGRDHWPTLAELEQLEAEVKRRGIEKLREGGCPTGVDRIVRGYLRARGSVEIEIWPADWEQHGRAAGPKRNRAMLDGDGQPDLFGAHVRPPARLLVAFEGGDGTADCIEAAADRGIVIERVDPVHEPRPWNRHHGEPPGSSVYVGRGSPLGNPFPVEFDEGETRAQAARRILHRYKRWLWARIRPGSSEFDPAARSMIEKLAPDAWVVCSCWPRHCHAEVIIRAWRYLRGAA